MSTLGWILAAVGSLGVAGMIALAIFAPLAAQTVVKIALDVLGRILSTRIGCAALAGAACLVVGILYGDGQGAARVQEQWDDAKVEYAEALEQMREASAEQARQHNEKAREREEQAAAAEAQRIETYAQTLPRPATDDCRITDSDLRAAERVQDGQRNRPGRDSPLRRVQQRLKAGPAR